VHKIWGSSLNFVCSHVPIEIFLFYEMRKKQENKKRVVYIRGGSFTCKFALGSQTASASCPRVPLPQENALVWEPPLQHNICSWHWRPCLHGQALTFCKGLLFFL
jgi:hypothetical protein